MAESGLLAPRFLGERATQQTGCAPLAFEAWGVPDFDDKLKERG
jgi:hypothetical protein